MWYNDLTGKIIGGAIEVHRQLGPGKPEAAYERALAHELGLHGLTVRVQKPLPVVYKGVKLECGYRLDLLVDNTVVVEVKSVETVLPVHPAQVLTYLKLGGWKLALLINFNVAVLKKGLTRLVLGLDDGTEVSKPVDPCPRLVAPKGAPAHFLCRADSGDPETEHVARESIAAAREIHHELGPGLLPSVYEECFCHELHLNNIPFERSRPLDLFYRGIPLHQSDEVDLLVGGRVIVDVRAVQCVLPLHEAALLSQLRLGGWRLGLLINFNHAHLTEGLHRVVLSQK